MDELSDLHLSLKRHPLLSSGDDVAENVTAFWGRVSVINGGKFKLLATLARTFSLIPHSNATLAQTFSMIPHSNAMAERVFSLIGKQLTDCRKTMDK